jgi:hypothetical protein
MNDIQERLRDAITATVDGAEPSFDVMTAVRRRHRWRLRRLAAAGAAAVAVVATTAALLAARHALSGQQAPVTATTKHGELFPGGGRLLLADAGALRWLYPDGRTIRIPGKFDGARVSAGELLAWRYSHFGASYYTMRLDGSGQRLVLPAVHDRKLDVIGAYLSPDESKLAYIQQDVVSQAKVTDTAWVLDLATGKRTDLGAMFDSAFAWLDDATILTTAPDGKSLVLISAATGRRSRYVAVTDPALAGAYEHAQPGAGPPAFIGSDGGVRGSGASALVAVWLAAKDRYGGIKRPAEVVLNGRTPVVTYAPKTPDALGLAWGPGDLVLLQTGAGDGPGTWKAYAATLQSGRPSRSVPGGMAGATFNPAGNVMALQDGGTVTFVATPRPACEHATRCLAFQPTALPQSGTVQAWLP